MFDADNEINRKCPYSKYKRNIGDNFWIKKKLKVLLGQSQQNFQITRDWSILEDDNETIPASASSARPEKKHDQANGYKPV